MILSRSTLTLWVAALVCAACTLPPTSAQEGQGGGQEELLERGKQIFVESCADCHGDQGQGVKDIYADALIGDDSVGQLTNYISETMPEGSAEDCVGEDAEAVAEYIHHAFYSEAARIRNRPPRILLARLTAEQLRQSLADVYASVVSLPDVNKLERGLEAEYFNGSKESKKNRKAKRVDPVINFDWGRESPVEGVEPKEFAIRWTGGVIAEESGLYEIVVRSTCSFVMTFGHHDRELINNHVQSGENTEFRRRIYLTGGRIYPVSIGLNQRKRKTELPPASVSLAWVTPGGRERIIPQHNLVSGWVPPVFALQADLPADDRTYGYERGIYVSRDWDASTTAAALEFATVAYDELWPVYEQKHKNESIPKREKLAGFLEELLEVAFHGKLSEEQRRRYVTKQLDQEEDDLEAVRRVLLIGLKSPMFLFPLADKAKPTSQRTANRLALTLFDSLPVDGWLRDGAEKGHFERESDLRSYAERYVDDQRVRHKVRTLIAGWLNLSHFGEITKDEDAYAEFDEEIAADLRLSLLRSMDAVVWSKASDYRTFFTGIDGQTRYGSQRLAALYGDRWQPAEVETLDPEGVGLVSVEALQAEGGAKGLLAHPYLLSGLAYHDSTSPIHRGVFLIRYMLGRTLRPPAEAFTPLSPDLHPDLTTRERVELQTSPASCQVCHQKINRLGFLLEHYDAIGRYRDIDRGKNVDSQGGYTDKSGEFVEFDGIEELSQYLAESRDAHEAFVRRAFQHFVKQPPAAYGPETLDKLVEEFRANKYNIRKLIIEIAVVAASSPLHETELAAK